MRELAFLNKGITIVLTDNRNKDDEGNFITETYYSERGLSEFTEYIDRNRESLINKLEPAPKT